MRCSSTLLCGSAVELAADLGLELTEDGFVSVDARDAHERRRGSMRPATSLLLHSRSPIAIGSGHTAGLVATRELLLGMPDRER